MIIFAILNFAGVVKLVDTLDLGSSASRCEGSSPFARTKKLFTSKGFFYVLKIYVILNEGALVAGDPGAIWPVR